jgi:hypothetical protein
MGKIEVGKGEPKTLHRFVGTQLSTCSPTLLCNRYELEEHLVSMPKTYMGVCGSHTSCPTYTMTCGNWVICQVPCV